MRFKRAMSLGMQMIIVIAMLLAVFIVWKFGILDRLSFSRSIPITCIITAPPSMVNRLIPVRDIPDMYGGISSFIWVYIIIPNELKIPKIRKIPPSIQAFPAPQFADRANIQNDIMAIPNKITRLGE